MAKTFLGKSLVVFEHHEKCSFTVFVTRYLHVILFYGIIGSGAAFCSPDNETLNTFCSLDS